MKKYKILAAVLAASLLCGCSNKETSSQSGTISVVSSTYDSNVSSGGESSVYSDTGISSKPAESSVKSSSDTEPDPDPVIDPPSGDDTFLVGLAGDRISKSDITTVFTSEGEGSADDLTEDNFSAVLCDGLTYVAKPSLTARNNKDNSNVYDSGNMEFTDMTSSPKKDYVRLEVGDTICGLTLTEAQTNFARGSEQLPFEMEDGSYKTGAELGLPEIYFSGSSAKFEGKITMVGYICCVAEDEYGIGAGDILFVPSDGDGNFPLMSYRLDGVNGFHCRTQVYSLSDLVWQNEFGYVYLGNAYDTSADISMLPEDGSFTKLQVTVDNFELTCGVNFVNSVRAELVDISMAW